MHGPGGVREGPSARPLREGPSAGDRRPAALVVQTSFLGDMVLTTPLIAYLARSGPVDVVATPAAAGLLAQNPAVRQIVVYDKRKRDRGVRGFARLTLRLRRRRYETAYLAQGSVRSAALALAAGAAQRVGFDTSAGRRLYTRRVAYDESAHHAARLLALGLRAGERRVTPDMLRPRLYPSITEVTAVDALLEEAAHLRGQPIVALAPGSVWATKRWPYYARLAAMIAGRGVRVALVGGTEDAPLAQTIAATLGPMRAPINAVGKLTLLGSAELIGRCAAIVTNDSAPQHLASAMGTATITIFGPTVPQFGFGPLAARRSTPGLNELACRPCDRHGPQRCPLGHWRCMREIRPEAIEAILGEWLDSSRRRPQDFA